MKKKLIFLDIDGTLTLPGHNEPPESALKAIRAAQARGHKVFLCTGRNPGMLAPLLKFGFDGFIGCAGGYVKVGDEVIFDCPMEPEDAGEVMRLLHEDGVFRTVEGRDFTWGDEDLGDFLESAGTGNSEIERWRKALAESLHILPMSAYDGSPVYKVVIMCMEDRQLQRTRDRFGDRYNMVLQEIKDPAHPCLNGELINRAFDKGRAIERICRYCGAEIADTIGFGDSMNDLEMIRTVGTSVCMANGAEALKRESDRVCPAVEEDGMAIAFAELGLTD